MDYIKANKDQLWRETDSITIDRYNQFARKIKNPSAVLDVGCNTGRGGEVLRKMFPEMELIGIDIVEERLCKIPADIYSKTFCTSISDLDIEDNYFDAIVAGEVIEHIPPVEVDTVLEKCYRLLKNNGLLLLTTPNPDAYLVKMGRDNVFNDPSHVSIMTYKILSDKLKKAGFTKVKIKGSGKATHIFPESFPLPGVFGSYLTIAIK